MNIDNLVHMANHIGEFFDAMTDREEALEGLSQHIRRFWAPRMRVALTDHWLRDGGAGLSPIVIEALKTHPIMQTPDTTHPRTPVPPAEHHAMDGGTES